LEIVNLFLVIDYLECFCMIRSQWLELRSEYLSLQKTNVAQLKSSLKTLKQTNANQTAGFI